MTTADAPDIVPHNTVALPFCPDCGHYCESHTYMLYGALLMTCHRCDIMVRYAPDGKRKTWVGDDMEYRLVKEAGNG